MDSEQEKAMEVLEAIPQTDKYILKKPVIVAGKTISVLTLDFDSLTTKDMEKIASKPECAGNVTEFSKAYLAHIVAKAAGITIHELRQFGIADGTALTMRAQAFLLGATSETTEI